MARPVSVPFLAEKIPEFQRNVGHASSAISGFQKHVQGAEHDFNKLSRGFLSGSGLAREFGRSVAFASASFLGAAGLTSAIRSSISAASDLETQTARTSAVFGNQAGEIKRWSETSVRALRMSSGEALTAANNTGTFLHAMSITGTTATKYSEQLVKVAANLAALKGGGTTTADVLTALDKALLGQGRGLAQYGIKIDMATIKAYGLSHGILHQGESLTKAGVATIAHAIIMEKAGFATDAFAKTANTAAGRMAAFHAATAQLRENLGTALLPTVNKILGAVGDWIGKTKNQERLTKDLKEAVHILNGVLSTAWHWWKDISTAVGGNRRALELLLAVYASFKIEKFFVGMIGGWVSTGKAINTAKLASKVTRDEYVANMGVMEAATIGLASTIKAALISTLIGALVVAVGFAVEYTITHFQKVKGWFIDFGNWIDKHWRAAIWVAPVIVAVVEIIKHWKQVKEMFSDFWTWLQKTAYVAVANVVEPFSHLPGRFGKWARDIKKDMADKLWNLLPQDGKTAAEQTATAFGKALLNNLGPFLSQAQQSIAGVFITGGATGKPGSKGGPGPGGTMGSVGALRQQSIVSVAKTAAAAPGASTSYAYGGLWTSKHTDCAGFTKQVMAQNGISIARNSEGQFAQGTPVDWAHLEPGDLVFFDTHDKDKPPSHVGIYIGDGMMIHDAHTGSGIVTQSLSGYWAKNFMGGRRFVAGGTRGSAASTTGDPGSKAGDTGTTNLTVKNPVKKKKAARVAIPSGAKLLPISLQEAIATASNTTGLADDMAAYSKAMNYVKSKITDAHTQLNLNLRNEYASLHKKWVALKNKAFGADISLGKTIDAAIVADLGKSHPAIVAAAAALLKVLENSTNPAKVKAALKGLQAIQVEADRIAVLMGRDWRDNMTKITQAFDDETTAQIKKLSDAFAAQMKAFDKETQAGLQKFVVAQTPEEKKLQDFLDARQKTADDIAARGRVTNLAQALSGGDPVQIAAAQDAINQAALDAQQVGLQKAADASRVAADKKTADDQATYQESRDALQASLTQQENIREQDLQRSRDALKVHLDDELADWQDNLAKRKVSWAEFVAFVNANVPGAGKSLVNPDGTPYDGGGSTGTGTGAGPPASSSSGYTGGITPPPAGSQGVGTLDAPLTGGGGTAPLYSAPAGASAIFLFKAQGGLKMAADGLVTQHAMFNSRSSTIFGEAGPEAYLPLDNPKAVAKLRSALGGGGSAPEIHLHIGTVVGTSATDLATEIAPMMWKAFLDIQRRNGSLRFS